MVDYVETLQIIEKIDVGVDMIAQAKQQVGIDSLLDFPAAYFSISTRPLLLRNIVGNEQAGCLVTTQRPEVGTPADESLRQVDLCDRIRMSWQFTVENYADSERNEVIHDIDYMLSIKTDDLLEIQEAHEKFSNAKCSLAGADEAKWLFSSNIPMRKLAFIRRLAMPMHHIESGSATINTLRVSLLDLLLDLKDLKFHVSSLLNYRLGEIEGKLVGVQRHGHEVAHLKRLYKLIMQTLERAGASIQPDFSYRGEFCRESYAVPERARLDHDAAVEECGRLLSRLEERKKNTEAEVCHYTVGGKIKLPYRIRNGTLLVTEQELSYDEFIGQKKLMEKVNKMLTRKFYPGVSRPRMQQACISDEALSQLRSVFFNERGCLRSSIVKDIDVSSKHGYISFANTSCRAMRNDYRWQVPLLLHTQFRRVPTRSLVETLLAEHGCIHSDHEKIHDLGILIGGTEDQSLHHDIPRQTTSWLPEDPRSSDTWQVPVGGWEYDRAAYNESMTSPYAPSSVLLGMGDDGKIQVGVQKNQIDRTGCPNGFCRIVDGKDSDQFRIVRENYYLVVLETSPGLIFTGDFQHAGVRNFAEESLEGKLMNKFFDRIESILEEGKEDDGQLPDVTMEIISMMCKFPNLHKICRFHCSTEPLRGPLRIPRNTVGFVDCRPNPPTDTAVSQETYDINESSASNVDPSPPSTDDNNMTSDASSTVVEASASMVRPMPPCFTTVCPLCNALIQCSSRETMDETLSLHIHACENSRARFKRGIAP